MHGDRVSVWDDNVLQIDGGDSHTMRECAYLIRLKMVKMENFMVCLFYHNKTLFHVNYATV